MRSGEWARRVLTRPWSLDKQLRSMVLYLDAPLKKISFEGAVISMSVTASAFASHPEGCC